MRLAAWPTVSASGRVRACVPRHSVLPRVSPILGAAEGHQSTGPSHPSWRVGLKVGKAPLQCCIYPGRGLGYPTFKYLFRVGVGWDMAKWDMQKEVSQAGQISFGEVKWDRLAWPSGSSRLFLGLVRIGLPSISAPVPRHLSLSLPVPPALCPSASVCCLRGALNHQHTPICGL